MDDRYLQARYRALAECAQQLAHVAGVDVELARAVREVVGGYVIMPHKVLFTMGENLAKGKAYMEKNKAKKGVTFNHNPLLRSELPAWRPRFVLLCDAARTPAVTAPAVTRGPNGEVVYSDGTGGTKNNIAATMTPAQLAAIGANTDPSKMIASAAAAAPTREVRSMSALTALATESLSWRCETHSPSAPRLHV